jgi:MFS family permease
VPDSATTRNLAAALLAATLMPLNSTMIAVAMPSIADRFGHSETTTTQALVTTYLVAAIALQSPGGKLGDRFGHWRVITVGQALLAAGALLGSVSPDLAVLAGSRVLMAAGGALVVPATLALVRLELPEERRGRAYGAFGAVMSLAAGIGPIVGGELVGVFGWRSLFLANLPVLVLSAGLGLWSRPRHEVLRPYARFDIAGSALLTLSLTLLVIGLELHGVLVAAFVLAGAATFVLFAWWQTRVADPVLAFAMFRSARFTAGTLVVALLNMVMYALLFEIPLVTHALFGLDSAATGRLLIFMMAGVVAASLVAGWLVDHYGPRTIAVLGTLGCLAAVLVLRVDDPSSPADLRFPLVLLGLGIGLANPAAQTASLAGVAEWRSGMAAGFSSTMRYLGGIAGVAVLGRLLHLTGSRADVLAAQHTVLTVFVGVLTASLALPLALGPVARRRGPAATEQAVRLQA